LLGAVVSLPAFALDSYTIDPQHSFSGFEVNHLGFTNLHGSFLATSGKIMPGPGRQGRQHRGQHRSELRQHGTAEAR
jgi:polyisoprenoid-binding protein YceI